MEVTGSLRTTDAKATKISDEGVGTGDLPIVISEGEDDEGEDDIDWLVEGEADEDWFVEFS